MVKMKTDKCPTCGGVVLKLAGSASKLCHDECLECRRTRTQNQMIAAEEMGLTPAEARELL